MPPTVVTVISGVPTLSAGDVAVMEVALMTVKLVAAVEPKLTAVAPVRVAPVIVTNVPPPSGPAVGEMAVTVGAVTYVKSSAELVAEVPPTVITVTSTTPADSAGVVAVINVELLTVKLVAAEAPNLTAVAAVRFMPVIVTDVPPPIGPWFATTLVTVGAATKVN